ncbi:MAG: hypothetical protein FWG61_06005 [Firmicutes bacterium]|nr:hypothetical protein [Bacillota bacterium]
MIKNINNYRREKKIKIKKRQLTLWLNKLKSYAIPNLMRYIIFGMAGVYVLDLFLTPALGNSVSSFLDFSLAAILQGQVWRLITFIFCPPALNILFFIIMLYFYWMIGSYMDNQWGSFKFNLYYFCGMLLTMLAGLFTGYATNYYVNLSVFLAFALTNPNFEILLFFVLPIKVKWLALLDGLLFLYEFIYSNWPAKIALLLSLLNIAIFLSADIKYLFSNNRHKNPRRYN